MKSHYLKQRTELYSNDSLPVSIANHAVIDKVFLQQLSQNDPLLYRVFCFIEQHYQQPISLREVAEAVGRSPAYLTDFTRRETGITVLGWIRECRMAEARRLLLSTEDSVEQIAEAVGYADVRHFTRQFRQTHQLPPKLWRKTYRAES